jgi:hypothetical protein
MDRIAMNIHGNADSHVDALCHVIFDGELYNGVAADTVTETGRLTATPSSNDLATGGSGSCSAAVFPSALSPVSGSVGGASRGCLGLSAGVVAVNLPPGERGGLRRIGIPSAVNTAPDASVNWPARSRISK